MARGGHKKYHTDAERKAATAANAKRWRTNNPEKYRLYKVQARIRYRAKAQITSRAWRVKNRAKLNEWLTAWKKRNPDRAAAIWVKTRYGLPKAQYYAMIAAQANRCAICRTHASEQGQRFKRLFVDHDHATGAVRGLLCHNCNFAIGHLRDDVGLFWKSIIYLQSHSACGVREVS